MKPRPFVISDRDGTIIVDKHYLSDPAKVELLPGAAAALAALKALGLGLVVISNQSGIGRGYYDEASVAAVNGRMRELLGEGGVALDGIFFCPHAPSDDCRCRKPRPALLDEAAIALGIDLAASYAVGDKPCDVQLGAAAGATTLLVRTGHGEEHAEDPELGADFVVSDLSEAAQVIERELRAR